ncbi:MAG: nucleoside phosphorylase [Firmicutes bacterium]|jgi:uridine phosphorylase|nr:nucleoside phosphorylase [Bacillota bacterium]
MAKIQHHIHCQPEDLAPYVLAPGDHARVDRIAAHLEEPRLVSESRGYRIITGRYKGAPVTACSTGMGCPQVAIAVEELANLGVHTFIRVGSCGARQDFLNIGDVVITNAAYRDDGTSMCYLPAPFPAVAHQDVMDALRDAARSCGIPCHVGITVSGDAFYGRKYDNHSDLLKQAGVLTVEMESSTLFIVAQWRKVRAGTILAVSDRPGQRVTDPEVEKIFRRGEQDMIRIALESVRVLHDRDAAAK